MTKIKLEVEVLLPTQVTKEVELPMYLFSKKNNSYYQLALSDSGYQWCVVVETEVKIYSDGSIRLYKNSLSDSQFSKLVAVLESDYEQITLDEFMEAYKLFLNQEIDWMNELINVK